MHSGHVRVYVWNGSAWRVQRGADIDGEAFGDESGWSVSLSADGNIVAIGAELNDGNGSDSGHIRIYKFYETPTKIETNSNGNQIIIEYDEDINGTLGNSHTLTVNGITNYNTITEKNRK